MTSSSVLPIQDIKHAGRMAKATAVAIIYSGRTIHPLESPLQDFPITSTDELWLQRDSLRVTVFRSLCDTHIAILLKKLIAE